MELEEGQIYEGSLSISGGDGPFRRWLVVAPFGKMHIHCIDDPLDLHCWPASLVPPALAAGRLRYIGCDTDHPGVRAQRLKEALGVRDVHLSINGRQLERLLDALRTAVADGEELATYLAGEILSATARSALLMEREATVAATVHAILAGREHQAPPSAPSNPPDLSAAPPN